MNSITRMNYFPYPYPTCDSDTEVKANKRYLGQYKCGNCARQWESDYSWLGKSQDCEYCDQQTYPWKLSYLNSNEVWAGYYENDVIDWDWINSRECDEPSNDDDGDYFEDDISSSSSSSSPTYYQDSPSELVFLKITAVAVLGYFAYRYYLKN